MNIRKWIVLAAVLALVTGMAGQTRAAVTLYLDQTAFNAATSTSGMQTIDFEGIAPRVDLLLRDDYHTVGRHLYHP